MAWAPWPHEDSLHNDLPLAGRVTA